jgi:hypothetical protein
MSDDGRIVGQGSRIQREVQALISSLSDDEIDALRSEGEPTASQVVRRPVDEPLVSIPFDRHGDHRSLPVQSTGASQIRLRTIEHSLVASSPLIRIRMGEAATTVSMLEQLGTLDDQPLFVRVSYHLAEEFTTLSQLARDPEFVSTPIELEEAFRLHFGKELGRRQSTVEAVRSDNRTAMSLRVPVGSPMMLREMVLSDVDDVVRELSFTHFRADRVALQDF